MAKKLSYQDFLKSLKLAPRLVIELLVENQQGALLLVRRENTPFKGYWHLPGGFLLKGEKIKDCIKRLAKEELYSQVESVEEINLGLFENIAGDSRGHILHYPVKIKITIPSPNGKYFKKLPTKIIPYQRKFLLGLGYC